MKKNLLKKTYELLHLSRLCLIKIMQVCLYFCLLQESKQLFSLKLNFKKLYKSKDFNFLLKFICTSFFVFKKALMASGDISQIHFGDIFPQKRGAIFSITGIFLKSNNKECFRL
jgi:hypothetical protein